MRDRSRHCWHDCRKRLRRSRQSNGRDGDQSVGLAPMLDRVEARSAPSIEKHARRLRKAQMHQVFDGTSPPHANGARRGRCRPIVPPNSRAPIDHAGGSARPRAKAEAQAKAEHWLAARDLIDACRTRRRWIAALPRRSQKRAGSLGGGLGVRLPAHATHEERPLFAVPTPIVNPVASGARCALVRAARDAAMSADPAQRRWAALVGQLDAPASIALPTSMSSPLAILRREPMLSCTCRSSNFLFGEPVCNFLTRTVDENSIGGTASEGIRVQRN